MKRFTHAFRVTTFSALAGAIIVAVAVARATLGGLPPKPPFPVPGRQFVAEYGGVGSDAAHLAYYWRLFGLPRHVQDADVLLIGSSHMQFGLSAREIESMISQEVGRPIKVINLGLGCAERFPFFASLLARLDVRQRLVIADGYNYSVDDGLTSCSSAAVQTDRVEAAFKVAGIWARFAWDWLLDGSLPAVVLTEGEVRMQRFIVGPVFILDWNTGDADYFFRPSIGQVFPKNDGYDVRVLSGNKDELPWTLQAGPIPIPASLLQVALRQRLSFVFTLVPYAKSFPWDAPHYDGVAGALSAPNGAPSAPFISVSARDLVTFDRGHLSADSRTIASRRLVEAMEADGLLAKLAEANSRAQMVPAR